MISLLEKNKITLWMKLFGLKIIERTFLNLDIALSQLQKDKRYK
jgi:hypothetical protein